MIAAASEVWALAFHAKAPDDRITAAIAGNNELSHHSSSPPNPGTYEIITVLGGPDHNWLIDREFL